MTARTDGAAHLGQVPTAENGLLTPADTTPADVPPALQVPQGPAAACPPPWRLP